MAGIVEEVTAADDRRHGEAHLSEFISLNEMIEKTKEVCPEGTAIPSSSLVRLQFVPRNPYSHAALNFTSKLKVQYKIQRRQLRLSHIDAHFCNATFVTFAFNLNQPNGRKNIFMMKSSRKENARFVCVYGPPATSNKCCRQLSYRLVCHSRSIIKWL